MKKLYKKIKGIPEGMKSGVVYTLSTLITRGLAIITVPIFTRIMTTDQIGVVNLYNSWYSMISVIATLSLTSGGYQLAMKEFPDRRDEYESSVLSITSLMSFSIAIIYFMFPSFWNNVLGIPAPLIILMLVGFLVAPARDFWMARQRYEYKYKLSGLVSIISAVVASVFSVVVVISMNNIGSINTAEGRLFSNYMVIYGVAAVFWLYLILKGKTFYNREFWKFSLSLSLPLVGYSIAKQILDVSDRMMISKFVGNEEVGIYSTLYTVSSISLIAWNAINASFVPYLFRNIDSPDKRKDIGKTATTILALYAAIALVLTLFAPEIVKILATEEYYEAIYIMPPIAAGVFLTSAFNMYSNILIYYKKTNAIMIPSAIAAVINIVLNAIFIPTAGYMVAAYTTLVSYIILVLIEGVMATNIYRKMNHTDEMVYKNSVIVFMSGCTVVISMCSLLLYGNTSLRYIVSVIACIIAFALFIKRCGKR